MIFQRLSLGTKISALISGAGQKNGKFIRKIKLHIIVHARIHNNIKQQQPENV